MLTCSHIPASTVTGLASELTVGRQVLINTQASLGVRAGCQLWERFFALFPGVGEVSLTSFFFFFFGMELDQGVHALTLVISRTFPLTKGR